MPHAVCCLKKTEVKSCQRHTNWLTSKRASRQINPSSWGICGISNFCYANEAATRVFNIASPRLQTPTCVDLSIRYDQDRIRHLLPLRRGSYALEKTIGPIDRGS